MMAGVEDDDNVTFAVLSGTGGLSCEERLKLPAAGGLGPNRLTKEACREAGNAVMFVVLVVVALPPEGPDCGVLVGGNGLVIGNVENCRWT